MDGGYDDGYTACDCFWGTAPGSLIARLEALRGSFHGMSVLDAGCGEGKNAAYFADHGSSIRAIDISSHAISNARKLFATKTAITWQVSDVRHVALPTKAYDIVVAYGLLHCLPKREEVEEVVTALQASTKLDGYQVVCAFNDRRQELDEAHPGFHPCLLSHDYYTSLYSSARGWKILHSADSDLKEIHPHNQIEHVHSLTRLIAKRTI